MVYTMLTFLTNRGNDMATLELNQKELEALVGALETAVDIADDTCTEALHTNENVVSFDTLKTMRIETETRIDNLVCLVALLERAKSLK